MLSKNTWMYTYCTFSIFYKLEYVMYNAIKHKCLILHNDVYNTMFVFTAYNVQCPFALELSQLYVM